MQLVLCWQIVRFVAWVAGIKTVCGCLCLDCAMVWIQQARFSQRSAFITEHQSYLCNALLILLMVWLCIQWPEVFVWLQRLGAVRVVGVTCAACSFQCLDKMQFPVSMLSTEAGVNSWSVMRKNRHRCSKRKCRKGGGGGGGA